jgi:hypothetical protein
MEPLEFIIMNPQTKIYLFRNLVLGDLEIRNSSVQNRDGWEFVGVVGSINPQTTPNEEIEKEFRKKFTKDDIDYPNEFFADGAVADDVWNWISALLSKSNADAIKSFAEWLDKKENRSFEDTIRLEQAHEFLKEVKW